MYVGGGGGRREGGREGERKAGREGGRQKRWLEGEKEGGRKIWGESVSVSELTCISQEVNNWQPCVSSANCIQRLPSNSAV